MGDGIELWLRRAGRSLLTGAAMTGFAVVRERWWLPLRVLVFLGGVAAVVDCGVETWKLIRSEKSTREALDRLEATERAERAERAERG
ncbi:hypothetical protein [Streptomyces sp. NPDC017202]|uniref:hypothetical protein n=1 Tax=Streptomyces sp. NPDC017202 TaxID=3364981 RepID=UPI00378F705E